MQRFISPKLYSPTRGCLFPAIKGFFDKKFHKYLNEAFESRQIGDYEVMEAIRGAHIGLNLFNSKGVCVLSSAQFDTEPEKINNVTRRGI